MQISKRNLKKSLAFIFISALIPAQITLAATDLSAQENYLKARVKSLEQNNDHANHLEPVEKSKDFHGVFYGFLPCENCNGIKATLSLKQNNLYLLVTQPAKESSKELYEKGKYTWDEEKQIVTLSPRNDAPIKKYSIKDEGTLIQLKSDGSPMKADESDKYTLRRSDTTKTREVHIH
ncbi:MAG: copper resistance protein NlpE [Methylococcales bacterium]